MPARSIDTATIAFGLVSIPVRVYSSNEPSQQVRFHMIHEGCGERVKQFYECPEHGRVERADISRGFELSRGTFVELSKDELKALEQVTSDTIEIREFVPVTAVDPILVDVTYYLGPDKGGDRAYRLLRDALEKSQLAGIAAYAARGKQYVVMVRPFEDGLAMHQLRYVDEVKPWSEVPIGKLPKPTSGELNLATQVVDQLRHETFDPAQYEDEVKERVRALIAEKAKGGEIVAPEAVERPAAPDLMAALEASLEGAGERQATKPDGRSGRAHRARGHRQTQRSSRSRPHGPRASRATSKRSGGRAARSS